MNFRNDLLLRAAKGEATERTPVWVMRQAGRVLPEYRATRARAGSFINLVRTPELACEVTLQPVDLLGVDAAIIFSDILVIPEALGLPYTMDEGAGPRFAQTIRHEKDLASLSTSEIAGKLTYVTDAIRLVKNELNGRVPLIGFAGAPWTIFCYMTEGKGSKEFSVARRMLMEQPLMAQRLLDMITDATIEYLHAQIKAGADLVQVFDSWAGALSPALYRQYAIPALKKITEAIPEVPVTLFSKGAWFALNDLAQLPCQVIGLDWHIPPSFAREHTGNRKTLQGNLDPAVLYGSLNEIRRNTIEMLHAFGSGRHIANLGHGVYPDIHPDHLRCFIDTVQTYQHHTP
ncbi:MAG: uroporphyrinogen decarboxylase [Flavobacteriales bacterium]